MQPEQTGGNWWDTLSEIALAGVDGHFSLEKQKLIADQGRVETLPPIPANDRQPAYVQASVVPGVPDYMIGVIAAVVTLGFLVARR